MSLGIVLIAHDNPVIQYGKLAELNALLCRRVLPEIPICLVTDRTTQVDEGLFDHIRFVPSPENSDRYYINRKQEQAGTFRNRSRTGLYELTPFEHTLVLDLDYLVFDASLVRSLTQAPFDVMLNHQVHSVYGGKNLVLKRLNPASIPQRWATVFYFRKSPIGERFFKIVQRVEEQYEWYSMVYGFDHVLYRNDFSFSIATHVLNGYSDYPLHVGPLPNPKLLFSWDYDQILGFHDTGLIIGADVDGKLFPVRTYAQNVHVMNKIALNENLPAMLEYYAK